MNKVPLDQALEELKEGIVEEGEDTPSVLYALADRFFIFDPLGQVPGRWGRTECLATLNALPAIQNPAGVFEVSLEEKDKLALVRIGKEIEEKGREYIEQGEFALAGEQINHLEKLNIIAHPDVKEILETTNAHIATGFTNIVRTFEQTCFANDFQRAEELLQKITEAMQYFGDRFKGKVDLESLRALLEIRRKEREELEEERKKIEQELSNQRTQMAALQSQKYALEQQAATMQKENKDKYDQLKRDLESQEQLAERQRSNAESQRQLFEERAAAMQAQQAAAQEELRQLKYSRSSSSSSSDCIIL